jgi:hypothetical protein
MSNKKEDPEDVKKDNEKNESEGTQVLSAADIASRKKLLKVQEQLEKAEEEKQKLTAQLTELKNKPAAVAPDSGTIEQMKAQIDMLSKQVSAGPAGAKLRFREPNAADLVQVGEEVTFTARNVLYVVASYRDHRGLEKMPPHKLIVFQYAASDVRREGKEDTVKNFSQYTTNLKTEIEYLREHPYYGIAFSENTNEMMDEDMLDTQFKIRAATQLASATPENIYARAEQYKIQNFRNKSANQLRILVVNAMALEYKKEKKSLDDEILKRRALGQMVLNQKEE